MIILGDPQITNADITATNINASIYAEKLQTFDMTDNMRTIANSTVIDLDFGAGGSSDIDMVSLCGTNLTSSAAITLFYSDTDITTPDASITFSAYSEFVQYERLSSAIQRRYWRISIADSGNTELWIGYIYIGKSLEIDTIFPHTPTRNSASNSAVTSTGQEYGSKRYNFYSADWSCAVGYETLEDLMEIIDYRQNIEPVVVVEYPDSINKKLYRPKYGVLSNTEYPFAMSDDPLYYEVGITFEERF